MINNQVTVFTNEKFGDIRTLGTAENPLFCANDVCTALGYVNPYDAIAKHVSEDDLAKCEVIDNLGRTQQANYVTESGLYALIFGSKLETAKEFKHWVTSEVLPSIRKTGSYSVPKSDKELNIRENEVRVEKAKLLERLASNYTGRYRQILDAHITKELTDEFLLPLPKSERPTLSATEIGKQLGISSMKVGQIANAHGLKTDEYGEWFVDKAKNCNKEVRTFRYFDTALNEFQRYI